MGEWRARHLHQLEEEHQEVCSGVEENQSADQRLRQAGDIATCDTSRREPRGISTLDSRYETELFLSTAIATGNGADFIQLINR